MHPKAGAMLPPEDQGDAPKDQGDAPEDQGDAPEDQGDAPEDQGDVAEPRALPWAKYCQPFRLGPRLLVFTLKG